MPKSILLRHRIVEAAAISEGYCDVRVVRNEILQHLVHSLVHGRPSTTRRVWMACHDTMTKIAAPAATPASQSTPQHHFSNHLRLRYPARLVSFNLNVVIVSRLYQFEPINQSIRIISSRRHDDLELLKLPVITRCLIASDYHTLVDELYVQAHLPLCSDHAIPYLAKYAAWHHC